MDKKDMEWFINIIDEKLNKQTIHITNSVTQNLTEMLDEKLRCIKEENNNLKVQISQLQQEIKFLKEEKRKNNLVFFGVEEVGKTESELIDYIKNAVIKTGTHLESNEISNIYRIGKRTNNKNRPVVVSITTLWKKHIILKNKSKLPQGIYIKEDYSKEMLEKRKQLRLQVDDEKKKGNVAFIKHNKLIVKKKDNIPEKRKREESASPNSSNQNQKKNTTITTHRQTATSSKPPGKDSTRPNLLSYIERGRSASLSEIPKKL